MIGISQRLRRRQDDFLRSVDARGASVHYFRLAPGQNLDEMADFIAACTTAQ